nr:MmcQ/YjbR family DNA-binding protein [Sedimentibacter sp.]
MNYPFLDEYLLSMRGATKDFKEEWQWTRYLIGNKMFAAICKDESGEDYIITLKLDPMEGEFLREQYEDIKPGYYMNKLHWNSVNLEGSVPDELLKDMARKSYRLVLGGLSKKKQKELLEV